MRDCPFPASCRTLGGPGDFSICCKSHRGSSYPSLHFAQVPVQKHMLEGGRDPDVSLSYSVNSLKGDILLYRGVL